MTRLGDDRYVARGGDWDGRHEAMCRTQAVRRYRSTSRGAETATIPAHQMMAATACEAAGPPSSSGWMVLTVAVRGWWSA